MNNKNFLNRCDNLLTLLLSTGDGKIANDFVGCLFAGYPVTCLCELMASDDARVVRAGAWLLSEAGIVAAPLVGRFCEFLRHPVREVRFYALDAVLVCCGPENRCQLSSAVSLICDTEQSVRWKAMNCLSKLSLSQLESTIDDQNDSELTSAILWLMTLSDNAAASSDIVERLKHPNSLMRHVAAVAAARLVPIDPSPLRMAKLSEDEEVASFARAFRT